MTNILVFTKTLGFRHQSIHAGVHAVIELADELGLGVHSTDSAGIFTEEDLAAFGAVVWMQTSGTGLLSSSQRAAYERFTQGGGGFAGVHAASDAERDWPLFDRLVGGRFRSHPSQLQRADIQLEGGDPSTASLPQPWSWRDEWYAFDGNPRAVATVLATVDEASYDTEDSSMGADHPVIWRTQVGDARGWYTALGHEPDAYVDDMFRCHLGAGIASVVREPGTGATRLAGPEARSTR